MVSAKNLQLVWVLIFGFVVGFESFDLSFDLWFEFLSFLGLILVLDLSSSVCVCERQVDTNHRVDWNRHRCRRRTIPQGRRWLGILGNRSFQCGVETATKTSRTAPCTTLLGWIKTVGADPYIVKVTDEELGPAFGANWFRCVQTAQTM